MLQGIGIFIMSDQIVSQSFPDLTERGIMAAAEMATVVAILYVSIGVITFYVREFPEVLIAYVIGFVLIVLNTSRHIFISEMNVPLPLFLMQILFLLACVYLMVKLKKNEV